jgi:hypothetical protein
VSRKVSILQLLVINFFLKKNSFRDEPPYQAHTIPAGRTPTNTIVVDMSQSSRVRCWEKKTGPFFSRRQNDDDETRFELDTTLRPTTKSVFPSLYVKNKTNNQQKHKEN